jgi:outer membrane protein OmpA-like peptidoglycan-associated protein
MKALLMLFLLSTAGVSSVNAQHRKGEKLELYINFESRKWDIPAGDTNVIVEIANILKSDTQIKISVEGHTDNGGNPVKNQWLSEARAKAVMETIVNMGIDKSRLSAKGWGGEKPLTDNNTEDAKARNRRVEIVIL